MNCLDADLGTERTLQKAPVQTDRAAHLRGSEPVSGHAGVCTAPPDLGGPVPAPAQLGTGPSYTDAGALGWGGSVPLNRPL